MNGQGSPSSSFAPVRYLKLRAVLARTVVWCCAVVIWGAIANAQVQPTPQPMPLEPAVGSSSSYPPNPFRTDRQQEFVPARLDIPSRVDGPSRVDTSPSGAGMDLRLRIEWHSPNERLWIGNLFLPNGRISELKLLEDNASEPGAYVLPTPRAEGSESLFVAPRVPSRNSGLEVNVRGPVDAELFLELIPSEDAAAKHTARIALRDLIHKDHQERIGKLLYCQLFTSVQC